MEINITIALIAFLLGMAIAIPLTYLLARRKANQFWQELVQLKAERDAHGNLESTFSSLAKSALTENEKSFLDRAEKIVSPLSVVLMKYDETWKKLEKDHIAMDAALKQQIDTMVQSSENLRTETSKLVQALRRPEIRGRWGEIQLRNVVEHAGMKEYVDFELQKSFGSEEGKKIPDAIVNLPDSNCIVIDAKTPIDAFLNGAEAEDELKRTEFFKTHAKQVRAQVKILADQNYQNVVADTLDLVVLFIPGETFYSVALQYDPNLIEYALGLNVVIASPMSLVALLKAIALGWQQKHLAENSKEIAKAGRELHKRLAVFIRHMNTHQRSLTKSITSYNEAVGSMTGRVIPAVRSLESYDVVPLNQSIESPQEIELSTRAEIQIEASVDPKE